MFLNNSTDRLSSRTEHHINQPLQVVATLYPDAMFGIVRSFEIAPGWLVGQNILVNQQPFFNANIEQYVLRLETIKRPKQWTYPYSAQRTNITLQ